MKPNIIHWICAACALLPSAAMAAPLVPQPADQLPSTLPPVPRPPAEVPSKLPFRVQGSDPRRLDTGTAADNTSIAKTEITLLPLADGSRFEDLKLEFRDVLVTFLGETNKGVTFSLPDPDPKPDPKPDGRSLKLPIEIDFSKHPGMDRFGEYDFEANVMSGGKLLDVLRLKLYHPKTTLALPPAIRIERVLWGSDPEPFPLRLRVVSGSAPDRMKISQNAQAIQGATAVGGELLSTSVDFKNDLSAEVRPGIAQEFELGECSGQLVVDSPQTGALPISFTVVTRMSYWVLLGVVLAGVGVGVWFKRFLPARILKASSEIVIIRLLESLAKDIERFGAGDQTLNAALVKVRGGANLQLGKVKRWFVDTEGVNDAVMILQNEYKDALDAATARRQQLAADLATAKEVIGSPLNLPEAVNNERSSPSFPALLGQIEVTLRDNQTDAARILLESLAKEVSAKLLEATRKWIDEFGTRFNRLPVQAILPAAEKTGIANALKSFREEQLPQASELAKMEDIKGVLGKVQVRVLKAQELLQLVRDATAGIAESTALRFLEAVAAGKQMTGVPDIEALADRAEAIWQIDVAGLAIASSDKVEGFLTEVGNVIEQTRDLILKSAPAGAKADVEKHLGAGEYAEAVQALVAALRTDSHLADPASVSGEQKIRAPFKREAAPGIASYPRGEFTDPTKSSDWYKIGPAIATALNAAELRRDRLGWVQMAIATAIAVVVVFATFSSDFVGTPSELLKIFLAALFIDIGFLSTIDTIKPQNLR